MFSDRDKVVVAADKSDLDQQYREAIDSETGEISVGDNTTPPFPVEPDAGTPPEDERNWPKIAKSILDGAKDQRSVADLLQYWERQRHDWEAMQKAARSEYEKLYAKLNEMLKDRRVGPSS